MGGKGEKRKQRGNILTIRCRIWQRRVVEQVEKGGLIGSVKGKWCWSVSPMSVPSESNVLLQLSIIHAADNERPCHPFSLISILQPFDRRNQRALAPTEALWPWASVYVCVCPSLPVCLI